MTTDTSRAIPVRDLAANPVYVPRSNLLGMCINYEISATAVQLKTGSDTHNFENGDPLFFSMLEVGIPALRSMSDAELSHYWDMARHDYRNLQENGLLIANVDVDFSPIPKDVADQVMEDIEIERLSASMALEEPQSFTFREHVPGDDADDADEIQGELHLDENYVDLVLRAPDQTAEEARTVRLMMNNGWLQVACANQSKDEAIVVEIPELGEIDVRTRKYDNAPFLGDDKPQP